MKYDFSDAKLAIFDLDGTLLDSMWVWQEIDDQMFTNRGMDVPEDYMRSIAGMSYLETALYTIDRFKFDITPEKIMDEWTQASVYEYANNVKLKPGSKELVSWFKDHGIKTAVATTNVESVYRPCLEHNGIYELFDCFVTTDETKNRNKRDGEIYALAAERMGVENGDCIVFEDVIEGILGAKERGMKAYCVKDGRSTVLFEKIKEVADGFEDDPAGFIADRS